MREFDNDNSKMSVTASPAKVDWAESWWMPRHHEKMLLCQTQNFDAVFFGDSIIHKFETDGINAWNRFNDHERYLNLGFSGDMTENLLWRIKNGALDNIHPDKIIIMIGTNNTGLRFDSVQVCVSGIKAIIEAVQSKSKTSQIILLGLLPRSRQPDHKFRVRNNEINTALAQIGKHKQNIAYYDFGDMFLESSGLISKNIMPDALHLSPQGYEIFVDALKPLLEV